MFYYLTLSVEPDKIYFMKFGAELRRIKRILYGAVTLGEGLLRRPLRWPAEPGAGRALRVRVRSCLSRGSQSFDCLHFAAPTRAPHMRAGTTSIICHSDRSRSIRVTASPCCLHLVWTVPGRSRSLIRRRSPNPPSIWAIRPQSPRLQAVRHFPEFNASSLLSGKATPIGRRGAMKLQPSLQSCPRALCTTSSITNS